MNELMDQTGNFHLLGLQHLLLLYLSLFETFDENTNLIQALLAYEI